MFKSAFGTAMKKIREDTGLSQEKFGFKVDLHRTFVSQVERGIKLPSLETLYSISKILGLSLSGIMRVVDSNLRKRRR